MTVKSQTEYLNKIRLGTRGSPLALAQAEIVKKELVKIDPKITVEIKIIKTSGDWSPSQGEVYLSEAEGGKALFAKELEAALLSDQIDIAVHSMKDMETRQPEGLIIPFILPREDVRDVFISNLSQNIYSLPAGSVVGTCSARRASFIKLLRPDLSIVPLRGNVQTRIDKLRTGQVDAILLARAGLNRLDLAKEITAVFSLDEMLPAAGQGAVGIEIKKTNLEKLSFFSQISCYKTYNCVTAEREALYVLGGSCRTSVGVYAVFDKEEMILKACLLSSAGKVVAKVCEIAPVNSADQARALGVRVGQIVKEKARLGFKGNE